MGDSRISAEAEDCGSVAVEASRKKWLGCTRRERCDFGNGACFLGSLLKNLVQWGLKVAILRCNFVQGMNSWGGWKDQEGIGEINPLMYGDGSCGWGVQMRSPGRRSGVWRGRLAPDSVDQSWRLEAGGPGAKNQTRQLQKPNWLVNSEPLELSWLQNTPSFQSSASSRIIN